MDDEPAPARSRGGRFSVGERGNAADGERRFQTASACVRRGPLPPAPSPAERARSGGGGEFDRASAGFCARRKGPLPRPLPAQTTCGEGRTSGSGAGRKALHAKWVRCAPSARLVLVREQLRHPTQVNRMNPPRSSGQTLHLLSYTPLGSHLRQNCWGRLNCAVEAYRLASILRPPNRFGEGWARNASPGGGAPACPKHAVKTPTPPLPRSWRSWGGVAGRRENERKGRRGRGPPSHRDGRPRS
jgi:hypothetical protein